VVVRVVEMVEALLKVERVDRAAAAMAAAQTEMWERRELLTRAVAVEQVGINHLRITLAKLAALGLSSSKCHQLLMLHSHPA
jgi:hypothetical protein